jgi:hypothetical protein
MNINVKNFKNVLTKATLNNSIENVQFKFNKKGKVVSNMISANRDAIVMLDIDNDIIDANVDFNFINPNKSLTPYLNLLDQDEVNVKVSDSKIVLIDGNQRLNIHFCAPQVVSVFEGQMDMNIKAFHTMEIDDTFIEAFNKIKKIAPSYGMVYFSVEDGSFFIETTDKSNEFSNGLKIELDKKLDSDDLNLCFDYKNFSNLVSVINGDADEFELEFYFIKDHGAGMLQAKREDKSETYALMSVVMEED